METQLTEKESSKWVSANKKATASPTETPKKNSTAAVVQKEHHHSSKKGHHHHHHTKKHFDKNETSLVQIESSINMVSTEDLADADEDYGRQGDIERIELNDKGGDIDLGEAFYDGQQDRGDLKLKKNEEANETDNAKADYKNMVLTAEKDRAKASGPASSLLLQVGAQVSAEA